MYRILNVELRKHKGFLTKSKEDRRFQEKYSNFKKKECLKDGFICYAFSEKEILLNPIQMEAERLNSLFQCWVQVVYEEFEYENAEAFVISFPYGFDEYDNCYDRDELELDTFPCDDCCANDRKEILYLELDKEKDGFCESFSGLSVDGYEEQIISIPLYNHLCSNDVQEECFKPVFDLNDNIVGYSFYGLNNILPEGTTASRLEEEREVCPSCGRVLVEYYEENLEEPIRPWTITEEGIRMLQDVNFTYEYRENLRKIIVSKKVFRLIKEKWPEIVEYVEPMFVN